MIFYVPMAAMPFKATCLVAHYHSMSLKDFWTFKLPRLFGVQAIGPRQGLQVGPVDLVVGELELLGIVGKGRFVAALAGLGQRQEGRKDAAIVQQGIDHRFGQRHRIERLVQRHAQHGVHPLETARVPFATQQLSSRSGPVVASTDYMKAFAEQIRNYIPAGRAYKVLGTDGFGRSDFRSKLREHFEINRHYIVVAALKALSEEGTVPATKVAEAIAKYGIQADKINPLYA